MAKGFARLGILPALLCIAQGAHAVMAGEFLITEIMTNPATMSRSRGEWFELYDPTGEPINPRDITIGDDSRHRHRIESDLLILPAHYLTLASNRPNAFVMGGVASTGRDCAARAGYRRLSLEPPEVC